MALISYISIPIEKIDGFYEYIRIPLMDLNTYYFKNIL